MTYQEDNSLVRTRNTPRVMPSLRSLAISLPRLDGHANIAAELQRSGMDETTARFVAALDVDPTRGQRAVAGKPTSGRPPE